MTVRERVEAAIAAMQAGDAAASGAAFTVDAAYKEARREPILGRTAIAAHFAAFFARFPGFGFAVEAIVVDGPRAVVVYRFTMPRRNGADAPSAGSDFPQDERAGCAVLTVTDDGIAIWYEYEG